MANILHVDRQNDTVLIGQSTTAITLKNLSGVIKGASGVITAVSDGSAKQFLQTDGAGTLSWENNFVNRGDPAIVDFDQDDFTWDGSYHTLDLTGILPATAKAVVFGTFLIDDQMSRGIGFAPDGYTNDTNYTTITMQVANIYVTSVMVIPLIAGKIYYKSINANQADTFSMTIKGWWF